jgi:hypothetical protein
VTLWLDVPRGCNKDIHITFKIFCLYAVGVTVVTELDSDISLNRKLLVKGRQMHHSFNVFVLNILLHVLAFQNAIIRESEMNMGTITACSYRTP